MADGGTVRPAAGGGAKRRSAADRPVAVIISAVHDPRTKKRGSIQSIADALVRRGLATKFLSVRFSPLSVLKRDSRAPLWGRANRSETHAGVECYLWRTPFHPFASRWGASAAAGLHDLYAGWPSGAVDELIASADVVIVESGLGIALIPRIRRLNARCRLIYRGSDALDVIGAHPHLQVLLRRYAHHVDHFALLARPMARHFAWAREKTFYVGQALDPDDFANLDCNPYVALGLERRKIAVSVGSMLFDPTFFELAAPRLPDVSFVVIGSGARLSRRQNVISLPEMKFKETLAYVAHADIGLAPYRRAPGDDYLAESSMKLAQYAFLRRPAVCPHAAAGGRADRFGYEPGDAAQIEAAVRAALDAQVEHWIDPPSWDEAVARLLSPSQFADTAIDPAMFG